ncbi:alpha/beta hydrolase family protein [Undibacterium sp. JH2W]|uniref:alpha/beta hydrolase family protein n=1 Tax=Undibacterium sp. JH2W TaxID=3413037 RepID=UPI003BF0D29D
MSYHVDLATLCIFHMIRAFLKTVLVLVPFAFGMAFATAEQPGKDQDITLSTPTGQIAGSLQLPATKGKVPVLLLIAGSGATDRDGNSLGIKGKNNAFKMLAESLSQAGIATVRFDKRGVGASLAATKQESELRFENYVDDAASWLKLLKGDERFSNVFVLGHSEGSLIAILAAQKESVQGLISLAGPAKNAAELIRQQLQGKLTPQQMSISDEALTSLQAGKLYENPPPELNFLYRSSVQPFLISYFRFTPEKEIVKLNCHVMLILGDNDIQVDVKQIAALKAARPDADMLLVHNMNHVSKIVTGDIAKNLAAYGDPSLPLPAELVEGVTGFLKHHSR